MHTISYTIQCKVSFYGDEKKVCIIFCLNTVAREKKRTNKQTKQNNLPTVLSAVGLTIVEVEEDASMETFSVNIGQKEKNTSTFTCDYNQPYVLNWGQAHNSPPPPPPFFLLAS